MHIYIYIYIYIYIFIYFYLHTHVCVCMYIESEGGRERGATNVKVPLPITGRSPGPPQKPTQVDAPSPRATLWTAYSETRACSLFSSNCVVSCSLCSVVL